MPSSLRLRFTPEADTDLEDLLQYSTHTWGEQQMDIYAAEIYDVLQHLSRFPSMGRSRDELAPGLRSHPAGQHVVLYRVSDDEIVVHRIIHSRRSLEGQRGL